MAHYLIHEGKYPGSSYGGEGEQQLRGYRFGRGCRKYSPGASAPNRASCYLRDLIRSIADAKLRRIRRELELRGVRLEGPNDVWIASSLREGDRRKWVRAVL